jgi:folate-dependent phosphoribosylglycinamide formyltransferase PurN
MLKLAVLVSGGGTNLQAILDAIIMRNAPEAVRLNDIHLNLVGQDLY